MMLNGENTPHSSRCLLHRLVVFVVLALFMSSAAALAEESRNSKLAGLWFADLDVVPGAPINQSQIMMNVDSRGTLTTNDSDDYTGIHPALGASGFAINGPGQGVWRRTGHRSFAVDYYFFEYTGIGDGAGLLIDLARIRCQVEVDGDELNGACDADFFFASDPDGDGIPNAPSPATSNPDFTFPGIWEIHGMRLHVAD